LNLWHEDEDGNVIKEPRYDPEFERRVNAFKFKFEQPEVEEPAPVVVQVPKPRRPVIRAPKDDDELKFNAWQGRRSAPVKSDPAEDARLVAEALAWGKVTHCPPGYARNAK
jgi:hypothetical protein